ncbi:hypothetical protein PM082_009729 [Marasmius tenuissimus]|nr:hypothetical protein PM082_009729 [Marasmius tenuissimus]
MPVSRSSPSRPSRPTRRARATECQSQRSPEPQAPTQPRLTKREREVQAQFRKWAKTILDATSPADRSLQAFYSIGSFWVRFIDPWTEDIELVLRFGFTKELKGPVTDDDNDDVVMNPDGDDEPSSDKEEETEDEKRQCLKTLDLFTMPGQMKETEKETFRQCFAMFKATFHTQYKQLLNSYKFEGSNVLKAIYSLINTAFKESRRNDTCNMKKAILSYLPNNPQQLAVKDNALDPFIDAAAKSNHGLNHPMIIPMLAPINRVKEMYDKPADHPVRLKLIEDAKAKKIELTHKQFLGFLYDFSRLKLDAAGDGRAAIFRGFLIERASRGLLTSPSSALGKGEKKATRAGNTKKLGVTEISDRFLAYITTQIWLALSDAEHWGRKAGSFELKTFYYPMLQTVHDLPAKRRVLAFKYLNEQIFGEESKVNVVPEDSEVRKTLASWADKDEADVDAEEAAAAAASSDDPPPSSDPSDGSGSSGEGFGEGSGEGSGEAPNGSGGNAA